MKDISVTLEVSKFSKSKLDKEIQFSNIPAIFSTSEVLKLWISIDSNPLQSLNKLDISFTLLVLNFEISIEANKLQFENILFI